jgi:outer membrane murein-binding lipoprotein Lpp
VSPALQSYHHSSRPAARVKAGAFLTSRFVGFVFLAVLALLYIAQSAAASSKTVQVQNLASQADNLQTQVDQLQIEQDRAQALSTVAPSASAQGLQPVDSVEYLNQKQ